GPEATARSTSTRTTIQQASSSSTSRRSFVGVGTIAPPERVRRRRMTVTTGEKAPAFDLAVTHQERVTLSDFLGRRNVLLVFHPFAFTAVCEEEALDLQENLESFSNAQTDVVLVSCDPWPARQAWKKQLGAEY